jgi:hypothetical protein
MSCGLLAKLISEPQNRQINRGWLLTTSHAGQIFSNKNLASFVMVHRHPVDTNYYFGERMILLLMSFLL